MKRSGQLFLNLYIIVAIIHIFSLVQMNENISMISKFILIPMLMLHVYSNSRNELSLNRPLLFALFFCWIGDVMLVFVPLNENFFLIGLAAFLIGHIFYIISFRKYVVSKKTLMQRKPWMVIPAIIYSAGVIIILFPYLEEMMVPVILYSVAITFMAITALNRFDRTYLYSFIFVLCGAIFFMISDTLIAINKFYMPVDYGTLLIMLTYITAQFLITTGLVLHLKYNSAS